MQKKLPMQGILLISDIDGTLIAGDGTMPRRNIDAIARFQEEGGLFSIATGRPEMSAERHVAKLTLNAPSILYNGSAIYDFSGRRMLWTTPLPDISREIARLVMKKFPDVGIEVHHEGCIYILNLNSYTRKHIIDQKIPYEIVRIDETPDNWLKLLFACGNQRLLEVRKYVDGLGVWGIDQVFSCDHFLEVLPLGVTKGTTLRRLAKMLGVERENIAAIGDYYNDMELIRAAGIGATVGNAPDEVKKISAFVAGRCEDGAVADLVEHLEKTVGERI